MFNNFDIIGLIQNFIVLFTAISVHEFSHGYVAYKLGDPTAKNMGRLTLNPLAHLDPLGALMMIFCRFGWANPVPVNPYYFKEPKKDMALVAIAGPLSNILLAFLSRTVYSLALVLAIKFQVADNIVVSFLLKLFIACAELNIYFAVFNLIPFPPLDGSKILFSVLPNEMYNRLLTYERYGTIVLIILSFSGILGKILGVVIKPFINLLTSWTGFLIELLASLIIL